MSGVFHATFRGPDLVELTRALMDLAPYARGMPARILHQKSVRKDWREQMLAPGPVQLTASWDVQRYIVRTPDSTTVLLPDLPLQPQPILEAVAGVPF